MPFIQLIIIIAVTGVIIWALTELLPMNAAFKKAIYVVAVLGLAFYVLQALGLWPANFLHLRLK